MSYNAKFSLTNPDEMEATLTVTMRLHEWRRLKQQMTSSYPAFELAKSINDLLDKATQEFSGEYLTPSQEPSLSEE